MMSGWMKRKSWFDARVIMGYKYRETHRPNGFWFQLCLPSGLRPQPWWEKLEVIASERQTGLGLGPEYCYHWNSWNPELKKLILLVIPHQSWEKIQLLYIYHRSWDHVKQGIFPLEDKVRITYHGKAHRISEIWWVAWAWAASASWKTSLDAKKGSAPGCSALPSHPPCPGTLTSPSHRRSR